MGRQSIVVPKDFDIVVEGVVCGKVQYSAKGWAIYADIYLSPEAEGRLHRLPELDRFTKQYALYVTHGAETARIWGGDLERAIAKLAELRKEEEKKQLESVLRAELEEFSTQRDSLQHLPICRLNTLIQTAYEKIERVGSWHNPPTFGAVEEAVRAVQNEIKRLTLLKPLRLILQALLDEELGSWSLCSHNKQVLEELEVLAIRSGGEYVEIPSLEVFYRRVLEAAQVSSIDDLQGLDLELVLEEYVIRDDSDSWAPEQVPYPDVLASKGEQPPLKIEYRYEGEQRPIALVTLPAKAFSRREARDALEQGTLLSTLPYGIEWRVRVEAGGKSTEGPQGKQLADKVRGLLKR